MAAQVHIIDPDYRRRAGVARELHARHYHAEIYEDVLEFGQSDVKHGVIFAADDESGRGPSETVEAVHATGSTLPVIAYASEPKIEKVVAAMLTGALDYLSWPFETDALDLTFRRLATVGERRTQQQHLRLEARARVANLSPRERDVLTHLVIGLSNKGIADKLSISPRTVEIHRANMMRKLNAQSVSDAVRIALQAGLDANYQATELSVLPG